MQSAKQTRVAIITGGARGFGKAFGHALAQEGMTVVLIDRDHQAVNAAAQEVGHGAVAKTADVTDEGTVERIMTEVAQSHGGIDILINNAGLRSHEYSRPLAEMGIAKTRQLFDVNVMGTVICTLAAQPYMAGRDHASVINISSSAAYMGGGYGTSKLAVAGLTITFARELASDGIRVNAIAPGVILTDTIRAELEPETLNRIKSMQFLSDSGEERDIVDAMLFLISPQARFITGETLRVTGGLAAGV